MPEIVMTDAEAPLSGARAGGEPVGMAYQLLVQPDGQRRFIRVSAGCEAVFGVTAEEVTANPAALYDLVLPEHRDRLAEGATRALASDAPFDVELAFRRADGEVRWARFTSASRETPEGRIWDGVVIDVTERRSVETRLEQHRRRLELAAEATGLGFWEYELATQRLSLAARTREIYGWRPDETADFAGLVQRLDPQDLADIVARFHGIVEDPDGGAFSFDHRARPPGGSERWISVHARVVTDETGAVRLVGAALDVTRQREAEERRALIAREMAHRAKNGISVLLGMISQSARRARTVDELVDVVTARLLAMGRSQDLVGENPYRPPDLLALMEAVLEPFDRGRFEIDAGLAAVGVEGELAVNLALLTHELATNALKYGALSNEAGRVSVAQLPGGAGRTVIEWREQGGPPVEPSGAGGFGTRLMQAALRRDGGSVEPRYDPKGFRARLEFPTREA